MHRCRHALQTYVWVQVSTIGYGDITPQNTIEQAVSMLVFLVGVIFFGVLIGSVTQLLQTASRDARKVQSYREKMNTVEDWIKKRHFPASLRVISAQKLST